MKKPYILSALSLLFTFGTLYAQSHKIWWAPNNGGATTAGGILSYNTLTDSLKGEHFFRKTHIGLWPTGGPLTLGVDSCIYGTTEQGSTNRYLGYGNLFKYDPRDSTFYNLLEFGVGNKNPLNGLIIDSNFNVFGVNSLNIYKYNIITGLLTNLHQWNNATGDDARSGMMQASNGLLYGTTYHGGLDDAGVLYSLDPISNTYTVLHEFTYHFPTKPPIEYLPGILIGITPFGGDSLKGEIYQYTISTGVYTPLYSFLKSQCYEPQTSIIKGADNKLYGTTYYGGVSNTGTLFNYDISSNQFNILYGFPPFGAGGIYPIGDLIEGSSGVFYGTTWDGGAASSGVIYKYNHNTAAFTEIHEFDPMNGGHGSYTTFIKYLDNRLYSYNEFSWNGPSESGSLFSIDPAIDSFRLDFSFEQYPEGSNPAGSLFVASDGNVYGINSYSNDEPTFYKYDATIDSLFVLSQNIDFGYNLYTTSNFGINGDITEINNILYATIYKSDSFPNGAYYSYDILADQFQIIASFDTILNLKYPSELKSGIDGNLYGLTINGNPQLGDRYILKVNPISLQIDTIIHYNELTSYELIFNLQKTKFTFLTSKGGAFNKGQLFVYDILTSSIVYTHDLDSLTKGTDGAFLINDSTLICTNHYQISYPKGFYYKIDINTSLVTIIHTFTTNISSHYKNENYMSDGYIYGISIINLGDVLYKFDPLTSAFTFLDTMTLSIGTFPYGRLSESALVTSVLADNKYNLNTYLFPNPTSDFINIKNTKENCIIKVYDVFGKLVITSKTNQENTRLETGILAPGLYLIQYIENKKTQTMKMVKN